VLAPSASTLWLLRALGLHALQVGVDGPVDRRHHVPARPELPSGRGEHFSGGRHLRMRHTTRCAKPFASLMATVPFVFPTVCFVAVGIAVRSSTGGSANQDAAWATYDACRSDNRLGDFSSVLYKCLSC